MGNPAAEESVTCITTAVFEANDVGMPTELHDHFWGQVDGSVTWNTVQYHWDGALICHLPCNKHKNRKVFLAQLDTRSEEPPLALHKLA